MKLLPNLALISDRLEGVEIEILDAFYADIYSYPFKRYQIGLQAHGKSQETLCICKSSEVIALFKRKVSQRRFCDWHAIIYMDEQEHPALFKNAGFFEFVLVRNNKPFDEIVNAVTEVWFDFFNWAERLEALALSQAPFSEIGKAISEYTNKNAYLWDGQYLMLFHAAPANAEHFVVTEPTSAKVPYHDPTMESDAFSQHLKEKYPAIFHSPLLEFPTLVYNLYESDFFLGQLTFDLDANEATPGERAIIYLTGEALKAILRSRASYRLDYSLSLDELIKKMIVSEEFSLSLNDEQLISAQGWHKDDSFLCMLLSTISEHAMNSTMRSTAINAAALSLKAAYPGLYLCFITDNLIAAIIDVTQEEFDERKPFSVEECINVGIGTVSNGLANLRKSFLQAKAALTSCTNEHRTCRFDDNVTNIILKKAYGNIQPDIVFDALFPQLLQVEKGNADLLISTLRSYCENNFSTTQASHDLHIDTSTLRYRLKIIGHYTDLDFNVPNDRLVIAAALNLLTPLQSTQGGTT